MRKLRHTLAWIKERIRRHTMAGGGGLAAGAASLLLLLSRIANASAAGAHGTGELTINWWVWDGHAPPVGWALVNFAVFVSLLVTVSRRSIKAAFAQRHTTIKRSIADAAHVHENARQKFDIVDSKQRGAVAESQAVLLRAQQEGEAERLRLTEEAQRYAERLHADMVAMSEQEAARTQQKLRIEIVQRALQQTETYLRDKMTKEEQDRLFDQAIVELEASEAPASQRRRMIAVTVPTARHSAEAIGGAA